jgi:hypothetical protein
MSVRENVADDICAFIAIRDGQVRGILGVRDDTISRDFLMEWALDPTVSSLIRVPIEIARKCWEASEDEVRAMLAERSKP